MVIMKQIPDFSKSDRYKRSSYRSYNWRMPSKYDTSIYRKLNQLDLWDEEILKELSKVESSARILDVGCATGRLLVKLAENGFTELSGVDLAPHIVEVAEGKLSKYSINYDLKVADSEDNLPWSDNSFDVILFTGVVHHFYRLNDALKEALRVLGKSGKLIIIEVWFPILIRQIVNSYLFFSPHNGDYHFYTPKRMKKILTLVGLKDIQYRRVGIWSFIISGLK